ncbi:acetoacetyl-CoA reductase [Rhodanobacter sp. FDAARGOS 1247]|uniref:acetoacetyl-CoA reductase n=1 Tax=Rhodanobacter sp. FDAARGOS 1247 TaxID=2778082 RepID=UPI00194F17AB|nr:acetoacetyl-CoA reductase [Rhodanobacter sp. FDAARGOS 1247]QRP62506.1 acetoacetyl-CoA reductase [Rhodanobacter sp. FDAARGOS 1247]
MNPATLPQRIALVTGGIGGLGTEICRQLAGAGRRVIALDLASREERVAAFHDEVSEFDGAITFEAADVSDFDNCRAVIERIEQQHGSVDIVVNAAGITRDASLRKMTAQQWHELMHVNLDGVFNLCRHVVDGMTARGFGRIVNISSVNGQTGQFGQTNYSAAKAGVHGFTMALARETARKGVTVNTVSPGYCDTPMVAAVSEEIRTQIIAGIPVGRLGSPADIARAVAFLAADEAGYITGANLPVNGGYFMSF